MIAPVAVVGVSWRTAPTRVRAQLSTLSIQDEPISTLLQAGYLTGVACVSTCSRTEFIVSAPQPEWAATLLRSALVARMPELTPDQVQTRAGASALHHLLRVVVGLDSVAEGEGAVGRQVLKAFESARSAGLADRPLRRVWKHVERLISLRRDQVPSSAARGVQSLVRAALAEGDVKRLAILGRGDFGQSMERALRGANRWDVSTWSRQSLDTLLDSLHSIDALVVCTGASHAWLNLPARQRPALCIDAGSPPQVQSAPGWATVGLDNLLARPELHLGDDERERLELLVAESMTLLQGELEAPAPARALAALDAERAAFLNVELPSLLVGLPPKQARRVRQAVGAFAHNLIRHTRETPS